MALAFDYNFPNHWSPSSGFSLPFFLHVTNLIKNQHDWVTTTGNLNTMQIFAA